MKNITRLIFLLSSLFIISCSPQPSLHDTEGHTINNASFKGKWVVINYWASWCPSCLEEIPQLNQFYQKIPHDKVVFYGVNYDQLSLASLKEAMHKAKIAFPVLVEKPNQLWGIGSITTIPTTVIINPEGHIVKTIVGVSTAKVLESMITL